MLYPSRLIAALALSASAIAGAQKCYSWCASTPCTELTGNPFKECSACSGPDGCHPGSMGGGRAKTESKPFPSGFDSPPSPPSHPRPGTPLPPARETVPPPPTTLKPPPLQPPPKGRYGYGGTQLTCKAFCTEPCKELNGNLQKDCGGCMSPCGDGCCPDAEGMPKAANSVSTIGEGKSKKPPKFCDKLYKPGTVMPYYQLQSCGPIMRPDEEQLANAVVLDPVWHDELSAFYLIHDAPIFVSEMPPSLRARLDPIWLPWIRSMETDWRTRNGGTTQVNYAGASNGYQLFQEAFLEGGEIEQYARDMIAFVRDRWLALMRQIEPVFKHNTTTPGGKKHLLAGVGEDECRGMSKDCNLPHVTLDSWINIFHPVGETFNDQFHGHACQWHGYLGLNVTDSSTSFVSPFDDEGKGGHVFTLKHTKGYLITLPAGLQHAAHPGSTPGRANPRITQAFDIGILPRGTNWAAKKAGNPINDVALDLFEGYTLPEGQPLTKWDSTMFNGLVSGPKTSRLKVKSERLLVDYAAGHYRAQGKDIRDRTDEITEADYNCGTYTGTRYI